ncbi:peptidoglycan-binding domain-containing protein [Streptomyces sp. AN091965]|uniref:peptidoglycan-binding domain-containing protein n=1 Tax=Streptomyces sp. AN091965 TaxID=2927803 RepID=UPI001F60E365|nr:peptidoglycan-binding domain-containing protein [Streptomyces sp. AN091965]MCI3932567.1 peptidoglycan-binding protein [Streptomyces sp. AN091965]
MRHVTTTGGRRARRLLAAAVATTAGAGLALTAAAPLATAAAPRVIDGSGYAYNDWGDEGTLSIDSHSTNSDATALWQTVLYADGAKWRDSGGELHTFRKSDITGRFEERTESATRWWQRHEDLEDVDGVVGKETFGDADNSLSGPEPDGTVLFMGFRHTVAFKRLQGTYYVKVHGQWRKAAYKSFD